LLYASYSIRNYFSVLKMTTPAQQAEPKPQKPAPDECCGGGSCCPCVWEEYREKLKQWQLNNIPQQAQ